MNTQAVVSDIGVVSRATMAAKEPQAPPAPTAAAVTVTRSRTVTLVIETLAPQNSLMLRLSQSIQALHRAAHFFGCSLPEEPVAPKHPTQLGPEAQEAAMRAFCAA